MGTETNDHPTNAIEDSPLLACPFCGGAAEIQHIGNEYLKKQVCEIYCTTGGCFAHQRVGILNRHGLSYEWAEEQCRKRWNTRISSAHDMLEALRLAEVALVDLGACQEENCDRPQVLAKVRKAIAKAEGGGQ